MDKWTKSWIDGGIDPRRATDETEKGRGDIEALAEDAALALNGCPRMVRQLLAAFPIAWRVYHRVRPNRARMTGRMLVDPTRPGGWCSPVGF